MNVSEKLVRRLQNQTTILPEDHRPQRWRIAMTVRNKLARRQRRLAIERFEDRENPSGTVSAAIMANGALSLNGDANDNDVQISLTGGGAVVTGLNGTTISANGTTGTSATLNGNISSLRVNLRGGNDHLSLATAAAFSLTGNASIDLGPGNNTLDLATNGALNIGGDLRVTAGNGLDTINVRGGLGSMIGGHAKLNLGAGGSVVNIQDVSINGKAGLAVAAGMGSDTVTLNGDVVAGGVSVSGGLDQLTVNVDATDNISGQMMVSGGSDVSMDLSGGTLGGLNVNGGANANTNVNVTGSTTINGNLRVNGFDVDVEASSGTLTVTGNTDINARVDATVNASGAGLTVGNHLMVSGRDKVNLTFGTSGAASIGGSLFVNGGINDDSITANGELDVGRNLLLNLHGGNNKVSLLGAGTDLKVGGNLGIVTGAGNDTVTLDQVKVAGNTVVILGAGTDVFTARNGTTFSGHAMINLGAGADTLNLANNASATAGVTFNGGAMIIVNQGADTLNLGLSAIAGGNANTVVTFNRFGGVLFGNSLDIFSLINSHIVGSLIFVGM
jgi:hypothetical protein